MGSKIMIVDDSLVIRRQIGWILADAGYEVIEASNGEDGLAKAASHDDLAMVLCDVNMPVLGGFAMLEAMLERGLLTECPVIMLTSEGHPDQISRAKGLGAKGWMVKPVSGDALLATVRKLVR